MLAKEIPEAVQWHEGMLLSPQHFQQLCARQEALLAYSALAANPFSWGVVRLEIDQYLLPAGVLRILQIEAIMPDGSVVRHTAESGEDLEVDLKALDESIKQGPITIHLGVPVRGMGLMKGELSRYRSVDGAAVPDENTGEGEMQVPRLRPRLFLLPGEDPPAKYVSFPLVKIRYQNETYALSDYLAPTVIVRAQSPIGEMCSLTARRLREKAMFLSEQLRAAGSTTQKAMVVENRGRIHSLVTGLPLFEAVLGTGVSHPYPLYLAFRSLVGHLSALGTSLLPPTFSAYNHNDLRACFEELQDFSFRMITEGISEVYTGIPFRFENGVFSLMLDGEWLNRKMLISMRGQPGFSEKDVRAWAEESLIGSASIMQSMREKRVLGAGRKYVESDEELIPARGVVLFSLRGDVEFIKPGEELQILNAGSRGRSARPVEVVFYVRNS